MRANVARDILHDAARPATFQGRSGVANMAYSAGYRCRFAIKASRLDVEDYCLTRSLITRANRADANSSRFQYDIANDCSLPQAVLAPAIILCVGFLALQAVVVEFPFTLVIHASRN